MHHPYQCIAVCRPAADGPQYLVAASGHKLFSLSLEDGTIASRWPKLDENDVEIDTTTEAEEPAEPPAKKRRLSIIGGHEDRPSIIKLAVTRSQQHVVVVTAEDKCIRVFEMSAEGRLSQLSARAMPKRPCAIACTPDGSEILSADKFGDVYSIPLLLDAEVEANYIAVQKTASEQSKDFVPAATQLTVHSVANRKALASQLQQAREKLTAKTKDPLTFSHKLLLGHVSMLTDMLVATIRVSENSATPRTYLLTADRDEHIRISRGPPQAHVIEGYCLGHHEFVSKMCLVEPGLLVSGGGDSEIVVWDWLRQKSVNRVSILDAVQRARLHIRYSGRESGPEDGATTSTATETEAEAEASTATENKIAVLGLWLFADASLETEPQLLVACEGIPAVLYIPVAALVSDTARNELSFLPLQGNPLDITMTGDTIVVSTDNIHSTGSTTTIDTGETFRLRIQAFQALGEELGGAAVFKPHRRLDTMLVELNGQSTVQWHEKKLQTLLYNVESLRKRAGADDSAE